MMIDLPSSDFLSAVAAVVVVMLLGFAAEAVKNVLKSYAQMMRPMMVLLRAVVLIALALAAVAFVFVARIAG